MFRLRSLRVEKFRDLLAPADLNFADGILLVLGRNASGKTNFLKLAAMVLRGDFQALEGEEFAFSWTIEGEGVVITGEAKQWRRMTGIKYEMLLEDRDAPMDYDFRWAFKGRGIEVSLLASTDKGWSGILAGRDPKPLAEGRALTDRYALSDAMLKLFAEQGDAVMLLIAPYFLRAGGARLDEGIESFWTLLGTPTDARELLLAVPTGTAIAGGPLVLRPFPADVASIAPLEREHQVGWSHTIHPGVDGPSSRLVTALGVDSLTFEPRETSRDRNAQGQEVIHFKGLTIRVRMGDRLLSDPAYLSYGQKRLIAFFWYVASMPYGVIIADELGNGLHHAWVRACIEEIGDRQAILAAQEPLVFNYVGFADAAAVRRSLVLCAPARGPNDRFGWEWRQPTEEEADRFFSAYQAGIQHVSEILEAHGLW